MMDAVVAVYHRDQQHDGGGALQTRAQKPCIVVGHSLGGLLAMYTEATVASRIRLAGVVGLAPAIDMVSDPILMGCDCCCGPKQRHCCSVHGPSWCCCQPCVLGCLVATGCPVLLSCGFASPSDTVDDVHPPLTVPTEIERYRAARVVLKARPDTLVSLFRISRAFQKQHWVGPNGGGGGGGVPMLVIAAESDDAVPLKSLKAFASARGLATLPIEHVDRWSVRAHRSFLQLPKGASDLLFQLDFA
jgi:pimeloyl-ACP methyl ester carboxylesterase